MPASDDFNSSYRRFAAETVQRFDQELQEVRANYYAMAESDRAQFRLSLEQIVQAVDTIPKRQMALSVKILINNSVTDESGEILYEGGAKMSPVVILEAVNAWESGAEYTPRMGSICR